MKRTNVILFALALLLSTGQLWAQEQLPYKSAAIFKGDTLQYLEYNFTKRHAQHIGKTVGEVLTGLEYPVLYVASMSRSGLDNSNMKSQLAGIYLYFKQIGNEPNELKDYYIRIDFENPPTSDEYREASGFNNINNPRPILSKKLYDFIKDKIVKSISSNEHIFKDPEIQKAWKEAGEKSMERHRLMIEEAKASQTINLEN